MSIPSPGHWWQQTTRRIRLAESTIHYSYLGDPDVSTSGSESLFLPDGKKTAASGSSLAFQVPSSALEPIFIEIGLTIRKASKRLCGVLYEERDYPFSRISWRSGL
jgi:hypothetical protein